MRHEIQSRPSTPADGLVIATTDWLREDEPALLLIEENRMTADLKSDHRWQLVYVGRGDRVFEFPRDLGPISLYPNVQGIMIFSGGEDSVKALLDMAEEERGNNKLKAILAEANANSTLIEDAVRLEEQKRTLVKRNNRTLRAQYGVSHERKLF